MGRKKYDAVGCHIYAGGFSLGVQEHFNVLAHLEEAGYGTEVVRENLPRIDLYPTLDDWPAAIDRFRDEVDFLYGNPPCAAWSSMGRQAMVGGNAWRTDERVDCARRHFSLLHEIRPRVFAWESVVGAFNRGRELVNAFTRSAVDAGYDVSYFLHDAQYLGSHQHRKRFFFVASRTEMDFEPEFRTPQTVGEVLEALDAYDPADLDLDTPTSGRLPKRFLRFVQPGQTLRAARESYLALKDPGGDLVKAGYAYRKLDAKRVSFGVVGGIFIHPKQTRFLNVAEMKEICGYPQSYRFIGSTGRKVGHIARAVMPPVGEYLARQVKRSLRRDRPATGRVMLYDYRKGPDALVVEELARPSGRKGERFRLKKNLPEPKSERRRASTGPRAPREPRTDGRGNCGARIRELILAGKRVPEILETIHAEFDWSKATRSDVYYQYRKLLDAGERVDWKEIK